MLGRTDPISLYVIISVASVAIVTDLWRNRIYNWLTLPAILAGIAASGFFGGWQDTGNALLGAAVGFMLYGWMFWMGAMGAGDVKLLMAMGAWGGLHYVLQVGVLGILLGGAMAFGILLFTGRAPGFLRRMYHFILTLFIKELEVEVPKIDHSQKMPFGVSLAVAAIWVALANPFESMGLHL